MSVLVFSSLGGFNLRPDLTAAVGSVDVPGHLIMIASSQSLSESLVTESEIVLLSGGSIDYNGHSITITKDSGSVVFDGSNPLMTFSDSIAHLAAEIAVHASEIAAVQVGQSSAVGGYATRALLYADLDPGDKAVGYVTNDPDADLNGTYRKSGATGAGTWIQGSSDREVATVSRLIKAILSGVFGPLNIFDAAMSLDDQILANEGAPSAFTGFFVTPYMAVLPGGYITFNSAGASSSWGLQFYDSNKTFISTPGSISANTPLSVPSNAFYARASFNKAVVLAANLMAVQGQTLPGSYVAFGIPRNEALLALVGAQKIALAHMGVARNLVDPENFMPGYYLNTGGVPQAVSGWLISNYLPVTPGGFVTISPAYDRVYPVVWYDQNLHYVGQTNGMFTDGQVLPVPGGAFFARISWTTGQMPALQVLEGNQTPKHIFCSTPAMQSYSKPWLGKKWMIQGTSIDAIYNWLGDVGAYHGATVVSVARGGRDSSRNLYHADDVTLLASEDFADVDMVLLSTFTNDAHNSIPVGAITDAVTAATTYGYTRKFIETVLTWNPNLRIVLATPLQRFEGGLSVWPFATMQAYAEAVRFMGIYYALPVIDFHANSGCNYLTGVPDAPAGILDSGVHPTAKGYQYCLIRPAIGFFQSSCLPISGES